MAKKAISNVMIIAALASMIGCQSPSVPQPEGSAKKIEHESAEACAKVQEFIGKYEKSDIHGKARTINEIYNGKAILVPFSYEYPWKGSKNYGKVTVGIEGRIGVYFKEGKKPVAEFELDNEPIPITFRNGRMYSGFMESQFLRVPKGYSVLITKSPIEGPGQLNDMLLGLRRYAKGNPDLKIDPKSIHTGVRDGLLRIGYAPR